MLDFHLLPTSSPQIKSPGGLPHVGGLEAAVFSRLVSKGVIDQRYDYYSDFKWDRAIIDQLNRKMGGMESDSDIVALQQIVDAANAANTSLVAFGD